MCSNLEVEKQDLISVVAAIPHEQDETDVAHASTNPEQAKTADEVPKKRKTRRGKRRHPYSKNRADRRKSGESEQVIKPEAPHNSNQFLIEDHGNPQEIDQRLRNENNINRTRDSSFSIDSDGELYSSPEDEEVAFLQKDFDDTYENLKVERLNMLSKSELIEEFLQQEKRNESKRRTKTAADAEVLLYKKELARLNNENEFLKKENRQLRVKLYGCSDSGSVDSESDSSTTCTTCSSEDSEPEQISYTQTNGHSPSALEIT